MNKEAGPQQKKEFLIFVFIFIFSFALRLIYLLQIKDNPYFASPTMDPLYHDIWAQDIANGNWVGNKAFFRAPFYAYFLALIYKVFGHNYFIPRLIQHIIGSFSCVLVYILAKKIFNRKIAILSAILASTYWIFIYFEGELLLDSLLVFFDLLLIILLLDASQNPNLKTHLKTHLKTQNSGNSRWKRWITCGLVLGLSAITRPNILIFIPVVWLWTILLFVKSKKFKVVFGHIVFFTLGTMLVILPVTLRNYVVGKDFVLIASQGGVNFYIGNNPDADGMSATFFHQGDWQSSDFEYIAQAAMDKELKPSQISDFYYKKGLEFIFDQPASAFRLFIKKIYMFWNSFEVSNNQNVYFFKRYSTLIQILPIGFWLVGPLSLVGMGLSFGFKKNTLLPMLFLFSYMLTVISFFITDRYRLPVLPILIIFSSYAIFWLIEKIQRKDFSRIALFALIVIPLFWLVNSNLYHLNKKDFYQSYFSLGNTYLKQGDTRKARDMYEQALIQNPLAPKVHLNLGMIYFKERDWGRAEEELLKELKVNPKEEKVYNNLSVIYRLKRDYDKAIVAAQKALEIKPYFKEACINLSLAYKEKGGLTKARETLYQGLEIVPGFTQADFLLAYLYQQENASDSALNYYQKVIEETSVKKDVLYNLENLFLEEPYASPEKTKAYAYFNMGLIWARRGQLDGAEELFLEAIKLKTNFASAYSNLGNIYEIKGESGKAIENFRRAIEYDPKNPIYYYNLGVSYQRIGEMTQAIQMFETALSLDPGFGPAKEKLSKLPN
ncbi:MAG TPA: tetratricopeptide repeat protein [candidate division Zixibacteria bacterium]